MVTSLHSCQLRETGALTSTVSRRDEDIVRDVLSGLRPFGTSSRSRSASRCGLSPREEPERRGVSARARVSEYPSALSCAAYTVGSPDAGECHVRGAPLRQEIAWVRCTDSAAARRDNCPYDRATK
ncbi:hypothetical protein GCM10010353_36630 [Streptomyces chryseus]|nr:hypothetical protein GCM10010353_36630 [Streptomyces chryseus]